MRNLYLTIFILFFASISFADINYVNLNRNPYNSQFNNYLNGYLNPIYKQRYYNQIQNLHNGVCIPLPCYVNPHYFNYQPYNLNSNFNNVTPTFQKKKIKPRHVRKYLNDNYLSLNVKNIFSKGSLTGYSVPVGNDIYSQFQIPQYNSKYSPLKTNSSTNTNIFSNPTGNEMYYSNGSYYKNSAGAQGKTGVSIIYD